MRLECGQETSKFDSLPIRETANSRGVSVTTDVLEKSQAKPEGAAGASIWICGCKFSRAR